MQRIHRPSGFVVTDLGKIIETITALECLTSENRLPGDGIDTEKLAMLHKVVLGSLVDDDAAGCMQGCQLHLSCSGSCFYVIPGTLQLALLSLDDAEVESFGRKWSMAEEFQLDRWRGDEVVQCLQDLVSMTRDAFEHNQSLLLWIGNQRQGELYPSEYVAQSA